MGIASGESVLLSIFKRTISFIFLRESILSYKIFLKLEEVPTNLEIDFLSQ